MGRQTRTNVILVNVTLLLLVIIWSIPTLGLFVSSFRNRFDIQTSGWWNIFLTASGRRSKLSAFLSSGSTPAASWKWPA